MPLLLGAYLVYLPYSSFTDEERTVVYNSIKGADYSYVILSVIMALASHLSRAWRWNYMLSKFKNQPSFLTNVAAIGTGYIVNLFVPRGGEVARAGVIRKTNGISMDRGLGTIIAERVLDLIVLLIITCIALSLAAEELLPFFSERLEVLLNETDIRTLAVFLIVVVVLFVTFYWAAKRFKVFQLIKNFISGLKEGFQTIWTMEKKMLYLLHTLFIWAMYVLMFYVCFHSLEGFDSIALPAVLSAFVAGSFSVAFVNGGFGAYPYLIAQVLLLFGYSEILGTSIGWILWLSQTLLVIVYGLISLMLISFNSRLFGK
ncbi:lysylphosphatidylglycerol synthase transmembrane domain-containing protein [Nonlabens spongiae]|uniref:lysylphosphatidylglycerol synthase transmembrane domain-containing protein n=1 Tax=Nonlabens spongiae TaxID=331648 RepID=UPI001B806F23|nr:lysylphosphatidylglycerol synthase transmembrane domain-containing protein [Nonlabens spongiae]